MKMRKLVLTALALIIVSNVSTVYAQHTDRPNETDEQRSDRPERSDEHRSDRPDASDERRNDRHNKLRHKVNRIFNALDTDGNDIITLDEYLAKTTEKAAHQFDRIDTDDDELISLEEFLAVHDHDDRPDVDRDAVRACVAEQSDADVTEQPDRETHFAELDTNDDGYIDYDEFLVAKTDKATDRFNHIDADGDGGITKKEMAKALMQHHERRSVRRDCVEEQQEVEELLEG